MLQFIKNLFKDKEKEHMALLLRDIVYKARGHESEKELISNGQYKQLVFKVRIPESFISKCAKYAKKGY